MNPEKGFSTTGDGTKRLRTHVWHAKRFTMTKLWGYYLPLGLHGRGRGSRALLKWFRDGVLIHDTSYQVAVQLEGSEDSLLSILRMVLEPSPSAHSGGLSDSVISGAVYANAMLHHIGAPVSKPIAPVMYMWRPCCLQNKGNDVASVDDQGLEKAESTESHSCFRQLWVWIHASAFSEGYDALKLACEKEMVERGVLVNCFSLEGQLAKLEVMGSKAFQLLQKTLPIARTLEDSWQREKNAVAVADDDSQLKTSVLEKEDHIASKAILSLSVMDPRATTKIGTTANVQESTSSDKVGDATGTEIREHADAVGIADRNKLRSEPGGNDTESCRTLWDADSGIISPLEESVLCQEKHELHKNFFCLDDPNQTKVQCARCCPILLLKDENKKGLTIGWSVILPLSWVRAFWAPLVSKGAHAIGLREKHWVACEVGLPYFPSDFPDCNAYACLKATEAAVSNLKEELRPLAIRPLRIPIPPPWGTVQVSLNRVLTRVGDPKEKQDNHNLIAKVEHACCDDRLLDGHDTSSECSVARTSSSLTNFLHEIKGNHLLLFPQVADRRTCFSKLANDENKLWLAQNGISNVIYNGKLCFLRVFLHAYKEGSFEEGAVVCAPRLTDITLWTSSQENTEGGLQIPPSAVTSYFKEQTSGKWELQMPEDITARESYRLPIGFVTTGFVRGSKKLVAEAFCEAVLLSHLREEQWGNFPAKRRRREIYVIVRNLRSTAYRLALATIVLEQQVEDVESL